MKQGELWLINLDPTIGAEIKKMPIQHTLIFFFRYLLRYILVKKVQKVDDNFHPLRNVFSKEYRYFINTGKVNI